MEASQLGDIHGAAVWDRLRHSFFRVMRIVVFQEVEDEEKLVAQDYSRPELLLLQQKLLEHRRHTAAQICECSTAATENPSLARTACTSYREQIVDAGFAALTADSNSTDALISCTRLENHVQLHVQGSCQLELLSIVAGVKGLVLGGEGQWEAAKTSLLGSLNMCSNQFQQQNMDRDFFNKWVVPFGCALSELLYTMTDSRRALDCLDLVLHTEKIGVDTTRNHAFYPLAQGLWESSIAALGEDEYGTATSSGVADADTSTDESGTSGGTAFYNKALVTAQILKLRHADRARKVLQDVLARLALKNDHKLVAIRMRMCVGRILGEIELQEEHFEEALEILTDALKLAFQANTDLVTKEYLVVKDDSEEDRKKKKEEVDHICHSIMRAAELALGALGLPASQVSTMSWACIHPTSPSLNDELGLRISPKYLLAYALWVLPVIRIVRQDGTGLHLNTLQYSKEAAKLGLAAATNLGLKPLWLEQCITDVVDRQEQIGEYREAAQLFAELCNFMTAHDEHDAGLAKRILLWPPGKEGGTFCVYTSMHLDVATRWRSLGEMEKAYKAILAAVTSSARLPAGEYWNLQAAVRIVLAEICQVDVRGDAYLATKYLEDAIWRLVCTHQGSGAFSRSCSRSAAHTIAKGLVALLRDYHRRSKWTEASLLVEAFDEDMVSPVFYGTWLWEQWVWLKAFCAISHSIGADDDDDDEDGLMFCHEIELRSSQLEEALAKSTDALRAALVRAEDAAQSSSLEGDEMRAEVDVLTVLSYVAAERVAGQLEHEQHPRSRIPAICDVLTAASEAVQQSGACGTEGATPKYVLGYSLWIRTLTPSFTTQDQQNRKLQILQEAARLGLDAVKQKPGLKPVWLRWCVKVVVQTMHRMVGLEDRLRHAAELFDESIMIHGDVFKSAGSMGLENQVENHAFAAYAWGLAGDWDKALEHNRTALVFASRISDKSELDSWGVQANCKLLFNLARFLEKKDEYGNAFSAREKAIALVSARATAESDYQFGDVLDAEVLTEIVVILDNYSRSRRWSSADRLVELFEERIRKQFSDRIWWLIWQQSKARIAKGRGDNESLLSVWEEAHEEDLDDEGDCEPENEEAEEGPRRRNHDGDNVSDFLVSSQIYTDCVRLHAQVEERLLESDWAGALEKTDEALLALAKLEDDISPIRAGAVGILVIWKRLEVQVRLQRATCFLEMWEDERIDSELEAAENSCKSPVSESEAAELSCTLMGIRILQARVSYKRSVNTVAAGELGDGFAGAHSFLDRAEKELQDNFAVWRCHCPCLVLHLCQITHERAVLLMRQELWEEAGRAARRAAKLVAAEQAIFTLEDQDPAAWASYFHRHLKRIYWTLEKVSAQLGNGEGLLWAERGHMRLFQQLLHLGNMAKEALAAPPESASLAYNVDLLDPRDLDVCNALLRAVLDETLFALEDNTAIIQYSYHTEIKEIAIYISRRSGPGPDEASSSTAVHVVDLDSWFHKQGLKSSTALEGVINQARRDILVNSKQSSLNALSTLHCLLVEEIQGHLEGCEQLIVVPQGWLAKIPFVALYDKRVGKFLIQLRPKGVSAVPSIYALLVCLDSQRKFENRMATQPPSALHKQAFIAGNPNPMGLRMRQLPGAQKEVETVASTLGVEPCVGQDMTKEAVLKGLSTRPSVVLLATHGIVDADRYPHGAIVVRRPSGNASTNHRAKGKEQEAPGSFESSSKISSSVDSAGCPHRGLLFEGIDQAAKRRKAEEAPQVITASEIAGLKGRLAGNLVVLSACETGLGDATDEGLLGLGRALLQAGAATAVLNLWEVQDAASKMSVTNLFSELLMGKRVAQALACVMEDMINKGMPIKHWAPLQIVGSPSFRLVQDVTNPWLSDFNLRSNAWTRKCEAYCSVCDRFRPKDQSGPWELKFSFDVKGTTQEGYAEYDDRLSLRGRLFLETFRNLVNRNSQDRTDLFRDIDDADSFYKRTKEGTFIVTIPAVPGGTLKSYSMLTFS